MSNEESEFRTQLKQMSGFRCQMTERGRAFRLAVMTREARLMGTRYSCTNLANHTSADG